MPDILRHTGSGRRTIDGQEVTEWYVIGDETDLASDGSAVRLFTPEEEALLKELRHRNWYTWSAENWGTKWNACHSQLSENCIADGYIEIRFDTAWAAPTPVLEKMFEMFPKLSFVCTWQHEGEHLRYAVEHDAIGEDDL